jgi:hypothetical protein
MNEFIKNYNDPKAPQYLFQFIEEQIEILTPKENNSSLAVSAIQYLCYSTILVYFAIDMIQMNILYVNFFQSFLSL